ncbi:MAG TPA: hypothetical protein VFM18_21720 [Methanosarcina sp.]|nr:hypothetical protein [Methanosarcina sp.]
MARKPLELSSVYTQDTEAKYIADLWFRYHSQMNEKIADWKELRNYIFATDTTKTTNAKLPWKNKTTLPKLCQIRDNLHSNYISALFPNDDWLRWEAYSKDGAMKIKVDAIEAYMSNKTREGHFRTEMSKLLYDYIDYGNAFAMPTYESSYNEDNSGEINANYIGPKVIRISPLDIVFNPISSSFKDSFKVIRSIKTIGELKAQVKDDPQSAGWLEKALTNRSELIKHANAYGLDDLNKSEGYMMDGFGNFFEYLQSGYVEVLTFYGDLHNQSTGELETGKIITVIDRSWVINRENYPSWLGHAPIYHVGWRSRPDNLWSMGPLDNLVGMQYRLDHLENLKADAMDLAVLPPLVISGEVEQFEYQPGGEIHIDENGAINELGKNAQWVIQANNEINYILSLMEQFAGAPSEAMGIRTPGEKTAFEVQQLQNAAGRIFQEKITTFEIELLEPILNSMLEVARRQLDAVDIVRVMDDDIGVQTFMEIKKDDITASGKLRPIGARHFAAQSQLMQNLQGIAGSPMMQLLAPHTSSKALAALVEDVMGLSRYQLFKPNVAIFEQQETQRLMNQAGEDLQMEMSVDPQTGMVNK